MKFIINSTLIFIFFIICSCSKEQKILDEANGVYNGNCIIGNVQGKASIELIGGKATVKYSVTINSSAEEVILGTGTKHSAEESGKITDLSIETPVSYNINNGIISTSNSKDSDSTVNGLNYLYGKWINDDNSSSQGASFRLFLSETEEGVIGVTIYSTSGHFEYNAYNKLSPDKFKSILKILHPNENEYYNYIKKIKEKREITNENNINTETNKNSSYNKNSSRNDYIENTEIKTAYQQAFEDSINNANKFKTKKTASLFITNESTASSLVLGEWEGKMKSDKIKFVFEKISNGTVEGYDIINDKNRRPFKGSIKFIQGNYENMDFEIKIKEPGDKEWDGEYKLMFVATDGPYSVWGSGDSYNKKFKAEINNLIKK